jgi:hypothetical protein
VCAIAAALRRKVSTAVSNSISSSVVTTFSMAVATPLVSAVAEIDRPEDIHYGCVFDLYRNT